MPKDGPTGTGHRPRDTNTRDTLSLDVDVTYADNSWHATFADDRKAAEWATAKLTAALLSYGISRRDTAIVTFTRR